MRTVVVRDGLLSGLHEHFGSLNRRSTVPRLGCRMAIAPRATTQGSSIGLLEKQCFRLILLNAF